MKIAILSRPGPCFPNVISLGLAATLDEIGVKNKIFYDSIPMLMRLLPFSKKPKRWSNSLQYRIRNKVSAYVKDQRLLKELSEYDAIILSECYPNAFWKNYFAIEELKRKFKGPVISYTESPLDAAPRNKMRLLDKDDYNEDLYDFNLFVTDTMEVKKEPGPRQAVFGTNVSHNTTLVPGKKKAFIAIVDFAQPGYESWREQQIRVLNKLNIETIILEGRHPIEEMRRIYAEAAVFFLAFPETFGLPIAECLSCGTAVFTPSSAWPMAWRLDEQPVSMGPGILPDCFHVYDDEVDLEKRLAAFIESYDLQKTSLAVFNSFSTHYNRFYAGDKQALEYLLRQLQ
ncbi:MAG: hypothetical protein ABIQ88_17585 [Chitinophagaceae bacterium]